MDFNKCPVRIVSTTWPPFILPPNKNVISDDKYIDGTKGVNLTNGIEIKIIQTIAEKRNFQPIF